MFEFKIDWEYINNPRKMFVRMRLNGRKEFISKKFRLTWENNINIGCLLD